ncbi:unnamed protein product [Mytilus coruscus]|uniref:Mab-21-like HhH/H2TH-like domain-containing protein n=1 Tax=Mytilus coruscus TaxID=42192 RepID=A0A6J8C877_MYTCO|nr:unnamed protein product [Mytilus coruscus]
MMNTVRDNLSSDNIAAAITSGSFGEGLEMQGSDLDIMQIFKFHEVYEGTNIPFKPGISCFTMETDDTQLGYTRLRLLHNNHWDLPNICEKRGNDLYLSGSSCKQMASSNFLSVVHGPCISDKKGHYDLAVSLHNFYKLFIGRPKEPFCVRVNWIENLLCSIINPADCTTCEFSLQKRLWNVLSFKSSKITYLYWYYVSKLSSNCVQMPFFNETFNYGNKSTYMEYKKFISTLLRNLRHDAVSGWLLLSSFFYKRKQYKLALYILQYSLSKCTSEKMQRFRELSHMYCELINLSLFRQMTTVQLLKYLLVDHAVFSVNSTLIPTELQVEVRLERIGIPPLVYAHFLRFLCHYHLNKPQQCRDSIRDLKLTVVENSFIAKPIEQASSYRILGIAFQLTGDKESAKQAFTQSIGLQLDPVKNSSYSRLSLINSM